MPSLASAPPARGRAHSGTGTAGLYDPAIRSDGLTVDTPLGPVDTVAIERALAGRPVDLTAAEVAYLFAHMTPAHDMVRPVATALNLHPDTVRSRVISARQVA